MSGKQLMIAIACLLIGHRKCICMKATGGPRLHCVRCGMVRK